MKNETHRFLKTGDLIRRLRNKKGMTQVELSNAIGYPVAQNISNMERGVAGIPDSKITVLANRLGVPRDKILNAIMSQKRENLS